MRMHLNPVFVATDEALYFFSPDDIRSDSGPTRLSLETLLDSPQAAEASLPRHRSGIGSLWIVPDIWLKHEFFPFQPLRESLACSFIERKLKSAYPHLPLLSRFYTFTFVSQGEPARERGLRVFFPQEEKIFRLYEVLQRLNLEPHWITSPALLWAQRLSRVEREFTKHGFLLIDVRGERVFLYFYHQGEFLFSRSLQMPAENARAENLLFEINQSNYLFAQKAKSSPQRIRTSGDAAELKAELEAHLETPIEPLEDPGGRSLPSGVAFLQGLWSERGVETPPEPHRLTDKRVLEEQRWRPVQWCGILSALCSLLAFLFIGVFLERQLQNEMETQTVLRGHAARSLAEIEEMVDRLLQHSASPAAAEVIGGIEAARPSNIQLQEVKIDTDRRTLELAICVNVGEVEGLRHSVKAFAQNLNRRLRLRHPLGMDDFVLHPETLSAESAWKNFRLSLKAEWE